MWPTVSATRKHEKGWIEFTILEQYLRAPHRTIMSTSIIWKGCLVGLAVVCFIGIMVAHEVSHGVKSLPVTENGLLADPGVPLQARSILQRACQDCHSDNTEWRWYSDVPPVSRQIHDDVTRGRAAMNLSKWNEYSDRQRTGFMLAIMATTKARIMPPPKYVWMHRHAKLSDTDLKELEKWAIAKTKKRAQNGQRH
jgi:hypothetical protein